jgi:deazaflavin-dependent oxidoreductase (nitroreductase family)
MPLFSQPEDSIVTDFIIDPRNPEWMKAHMQAYLASQGEDGFYVDFRPIGGPARVPTLILTTTGRKSGQPQSLPLIFGQFDERYVIIASKGGWPEHPAWFLNLEARPTARIQVRGEQFQVKARAADEPERSDLWKRMLAIYPLFDKYQARTERQIPVVVLTKG